MKTLAWKRVEFWSAVGLVLFFFLPWISEGGFISFSGYQVADMLRQSKATHTDVDFINGKNFSKMFSDSILTLGQKGGLYLIPISALLCVVVDLFHRSKKPGLLYLIAGIIPFIALAGVLAEKDGSDNLKYLTIGAWLTLLAAIGCFIGTFLGMTLRPTKAPLLAEPSVSSK